MEGSERHVSSLTVPSVPWECHARAVDIIRHRRTDRISASTSPRALWEGEVGSDAGSWESIPLEDQGSFPTVDGALARLGASYTYLALLEEGGGRNTTALRLLRLALVTKRGALRQAGAPAHPTLAAAHGHIARVAGALRRRTTQRKALDRQYDQVAAWLAWESGEAGPWLDAHPVLMQIEAEIERLNDERRSRVRERKRARRAKLAGEAEGDEDEGDDDDDDDDEEEEEDEDDVVEDEDEAEVDVGEEGVDDDDAVAVRVRTRPEVLRDHVLDDSFGDEDDDDDADIPDDDDSVAEVWPTKTL